MQINGTVISYTPSTKVAKNGGGTYDAWELVYRTPENEVKQLAKPIQSLKYATALKEALASLKANDEFTADLEKNAAGFWEVKSVVKGAVAAPVVAPAAVVKGSEAVATDNRPAPARAVNRVTGSTYETPEERAKKQVVIVRQSCIGYALTYLANNEAKQEPVETVLTVAKEFEKFVNAGLKAAASKYLAVVLKDDENGV